MKKLTLLLINTLALFILSGCSLFTPFELKEETITMEYGDTLSEDVSAYVTAGNYDEIAYDYSEAYVEHSEFCQGNNLGTATFTNTKGEELTMNIDWRDTTAPAISNTEINFYGFYMGLSQIKASFGFGMYDILQQIEAQDALGGYISNFTIDDNTLLSEEDVATSMSYSLANHFGEAGVIKPYWGGNVTTTSFGKSYNNDYFSPFGNYYNLEYGTHEIELSLTDWAGNTSNHLITLNYIKGISPEEMESNNLTEEEVNSMIEQAY